MASYQIKQRDPLFDSNMQAAIERRGKELLGLGLIALGVMVAMLLASYVPEDPSWLSATDEPASNLLGRFGASVASPLHVIVGLGAWGIAVVPIGWGMRFVLHRGEDRALGRVVFAPIAIALAAIYAATLTPAAGWTHEFGMGGLFGDTVLGAILNIVPVTAAFGLKLMAVGAFAVLIGFGFFVLGFDRSELRALLRFLILGLVVTYAQLMTLLGRGASGAVQGARLMQARNQARRMAEAAPHNEPIVHRAVAAAAAPTAPAPVKAGLLGRMPTLMKRQPDPEPELIEPISPEYNGDPISEDRIKARIADVIRSRVRQAPVERSEPQLVAERREPPVVNTAVSAAIARRRGAPDPLLARETPRMTPPPQPLVLEPEDEIDVFDVDAFDPLFDEPEAMTSYDLPVSTPRKVVQHPVKKLVQPSRRAQEEAQPALQFDEQAAAYEHPPLSLLTSPVHIERHHLSDEALEENARMLENVLDDYGVKGEIVSVRPGPVVTMYELEPAPGLKASRVIGLADDIARSMSALSARVSTVPGRSVIGIELPNVNREKVVLREILSARDFGDSNMRLPLALGKDIGGDPVVANLAKMPHLLIAGTTGSGKSVAINTMILSLLYKLTPEECRLIMIDPKMLELSVYDGIPHLLSPVVTDPKKAVVALKWVVGEMEERYRKMSKMGVRNIEGFNGRVRDALAKGEMFKRTVQTGFDDDTGEPIFETEQFQPEALPYIVVIVDEMADLMMVAGKEIEACIQRLAQMARASGIHLIMATQRPSVDVITGTIKANFPTRISFQVTSKIDSRTILGEQGAEQLLGMGDMLYMAGGAKITRVHGPFVSDEEVEEIVTYLKAFGPPDYMSGVTEGPDEDRESDIDLVLGLGGNTDMEDALYDTAVAIVLKDRKCSTSYIQRKLAIGYNKAARLVEQMEDQGVVSAANHVGKREILVPEQ
ncbi:DNA translocase FtsK [Actibacterium sp.]|uniref:DNA translocase FtsK n=1 Tax=Actibacterium sp. TaxID=1872125 RepID=UPI003563AED0